VFAYCQEMPGVTEEMAARVESEVGGTPVPGLIAHVGGPTARGWRIIDVWESEDDFHQFQSERLVPAVQTANKGANPSRQPFEFLSVSSVNGSARRG
jgi:hypothetical protein